MLNIDGVLFDLGGTLDGETHWLERFCALYPQLGFSFSRETIRAGFDTAEAVNAADDSIRAAPLAEMVRRHVAAQFRFHQIENPAAENEMVSRFIADVETAARSNVELLADLSANGFRLGVISNGCGNTAVLCDELGYTPFLKIVLDSQRVGLSKPDPRFFAFAAREIGCEPSRLLMVGDSLERDMQPAKQIGMQTVWLNSRAGKHPAADFTIERLSELRRILLPAKK
jgi:putative hydrolase of the HAD superfamily